MNNQHPLTIAEEYNELPKRRRVKRVAFLCASIFISVCALIAHGGAITNALFYIPSHVTYDHSREKCTFGASLLSIKSAGDSETFALSRSPLVKIGSLELFSFQNCVAPRLLPENNREYVLNVSQMNVPIHKKIVIRAESFPKLEPRITSDLLATTDLLAFDGVHPNMYPFEYRLMSDDKKTECEMQSNSVLCPVLPLNLAQGQSVDLALVTALGGREEVLLSKTFITVEPVNIIDSSIKAHDVIFAKPHEAILTFSKEIESASVKLYDTTSHSDLVVQSEISSDGKQLNVIWESELERGHDFTLTIDTAQSKDGGYLEEPYTIPFKTSIGPKVSAISISDFKVPLNPSIVLDFDQPLDQNTINAVSLAGVDVSYELNGARLTLRPSSALSRCQAYTISVNATLANIFGVSGHNEYSHTFRAICQYIDSIGVSHGGRQLTTYTFGSGGTVLLFVGATHGDEPSSKYILDSFIDYLEQNPSVIPSDKKVVILPSLNPDGVAASTRVNAHSVDLNRNFPANNWKSSVVMPGGYTLETGGGETALSEPESLALANYITQVRPRFVFTYHAKGQLVMGNGSGDSFAVASWYGDEVGYADESGNSNEAVFTHDTTGAFEDWLHDKESIPALLIELKNYTGNEFWLHRPAMVRALRI